MLEKIKNLWFITRFDSNLKNVILVILAFYISNTEITIQNINQMFLGILSLSLLSSGAYTYNSYTDYFLDKNNKNKKHYHEAIKNIGRKKTFWLFWILIFLGFSVGYTINKIFFITIIFYALVNFLYTNPITRFKEKKYLDILFGAGLTHMLRFTAGWYIFATTAPPFFVLIILSLSKMAGFMMYKNLDRDYLKQQGIKNTTTSFNPKLLNTVSGIFLAISTILFIIICFNGVYFNYNFIGKLPIESLLILIPIFTFFYWGTKIQKKEKYNFKKIRFYTLLISLVLFLIIGLILFFKNYA